MVVGIQYCGGCNPRFDRTFVVERLQKEFPMITLFYFGFGEAKSPDFSVVIAGCESSCAADDTPAGTLGKFILTKPEEYEQLAGLLRAALQR